MRTFVREPDRSPLSIVGRSADNMRCPVTAYHQPTREKTMSTETPYGWNAATGTTLLAKLKSDLKAAMLSKNETVKGALRIIISEFPTKITMPITLESGKKSTRAKREEEITAWAKENVDLSQFKNAMQAMGPIMKHFGKSADGKVVKKVLGTLG